MLACLFDTMIVKFTLAGTAGAHKPPSFAEFSLGPESGQGVLGRGKGQWRDRQKPMRPHSHPHTKWALCEKHFHLPRQDEGQNQEVWGASLPGQWGLLGS